MIRTKVIPFVRQESLPETEEQWKRAFRHEEEILAMYVQAHRPTAAEIRIVRAVRDAAATRITQTHRTLATAITRSAVPAEAVSLRVAEVHTAVARWEAEVHAAAAEEVEVHADGKR